MRLICPNCGAQYEVPPEVIPKTGRDVQCSDCGTTWFQHHPDHPAAENVVTDPGEQSRERAADTDPEKAAPHSDSSDKSDTEVADYTAEEEIAEPEVVASGENVTQEEAEAEPHEGMVEENGDPNALGSETGDNTETVIEPELNDVETDENGFANDEEADVSAHDAWPNPGSEENEPIAEEPVSKQADIMPPPADEASDPETSGDAILEDERAGEENEADKASDDAQPDEIAPEDVSTGEAEVFETESDQEEAHQTYAETSASEDETPAETVSGETDPEDFSDDESASIDSGRELPDRKPLDADIAKVLQQEAAREALAREEERRSGLESQPELGLTQSDSTARQRTLEAEARMARLRGDDTVAADNTPDELMLITDAEDLGTDLAPRSNLLPDIDEINSSLDPETGREPQADSEGADGAVDTNRTGFRTGFRLAVLIALLGVVLYAFAPQVAAAIPQLEGVLSSYVGVINGIQAQIDAVIDGFIESIEVPIE